MFLLQLVSQIRTIEATWESSCSTLEKKILKVNQIMYYKCFGGAPVWLLYAQLMKQGVGGGEAGVDGWFWCSVVSQTPPTVFTSSKLTTHDATDVHAIVCLMPCQRVPELFPFFRIGNRRYSYQSVINLLIQVFISRGQIYSPSCLSVGDRSIHLVVYQSGIDLFTQLFISQGQSIHLVVYQSVIDLFTQLFISR